MHTSRKHIAWRWAVVVAAVLGTGAWLTWGKSEPRSLRLPSTRNLAPPDLDLPSDEVRQTLQQGMTLLHRPPQRKALAGIDLTFLPEAGGARKQEAPPVMLGLVFQGQSRRYAVINGRVYAPEQRLPDGRQVAAVTEHGVLLVDEQSQQWLPWQNPRVVRLQQGGSTSSAPAETQKSQKSQSSSQATVATQEELNSLLQQQGTPE